MLFGLLKELTDRFIEFTLKMVKGDTPEAQLTSALKSCVLLIAGLSTLVVTLAGNNWELHKRYKDYESTVSKLGFILNPDNMHGASKEISALVKSIDRNTNTIRQENIRLSGVNVTLAAENNTLHLILGKQLAEVIHLRRDNDLLMRMCVFRAEGG